MLNPKIIANLHATSHIQTRYLQFKNQMKIFISSTCYDLIDIRAEVNFTLKEAGLTPIMSDQLNSDFNIKTNTNSIETCLINLRNSDMVIFILSKRYGSKLGKSGFEDISATHLEYKEAVKQNKTILFYLRDRLEADFNLFKKINKASKLSWISEKDIGLFEIIKEHTKLTNTKKNNWFYSFSNSIDLKERLKIDLENDITQIKLDSILKSGNTPYLVVKYEIKTIEPSKLELYLIVENIGIQPALDPVVAITRADTYQEILDNNFYDDILNYQITTLNFIKPNENERVYQEIALNDGKNVFFIEIFYKTVTGEVLSDITRLNIQDLKIHDETKKSINIKI